MSDNRASCPRCAHQRRFHWPDDERSRPGCHANQCLCSWDPDEVDRAVESEQQLRGSGT